MYKAKEPFGFEFDSQEKVDEFNNECTSCFGGCANKNDVWGECCNNCGIINECIALYEGNK